MNKIFVLHLFCGNEVFLVCGLERFIGILISIYENHSRLIGCCNELIDCGCAITLINSSKLHLRNASITFCMC